MPALPPNADVTSGRLPVAGVQRIGCSVSIGRSQVEILYMSTIDPRFSFNANTADAAVEEMSLVPPQHRQDDEDDSSELEVARTADYSNMEDLCVRNSTACRAAEIKLTL